MGKINMPRSLTLWCGLSGARHGFNLDELTGPIVRVGYTKRFEVNVATVVKWIENKS